MFWQFNCLHQLHHCRVVRPPQQVSWIYDTKQSDGEVAIMLKLWGMQSTPSLLSLPCQFWPGVVSMGQIELNCALMLNWIVWNCLPSWKLYKLDEPDTQDTAGEARTNSSVMYSYGAPHMAKQKQDDQLEHTYSSYVRIQDVTLKTCQKWWMIGRSGERGSEISVLAARHDDDDLYKNGFGVKLPTKVDMP